MRVRYLSIFLVLLLAGCGWLNKEMHVKCKGKGVLTGVAGVYGGTVSGDCGDGFEYERRSVPSERRLP